MGKGPALACLGGGERRWVRSSQLPTGFRHAESLHEVRQSPESPGTLEIAAPHAELDQGFRARVILPGQPKRRGEEHEFAARLLCDEPREDGGPQLVRVGPDGRLYQIDLAASCDAEVRLVKAVESSTNF